MQIKTLLTTSTQKLGGEEAALEAQLLLQHVLGVNHAWLIVHANDEIAQTSESAFLSLIERRLTGEPVAYILGEREFFGLPFIVTPDTLIPRSDTESLVEAALSKLPLPESASNNLNLLDLGTGSGAIALAIAHSRPDIDVIAVDASEKALAIADQNAEKLAVENVDFVQSDWFDTLGMQTFDLIVSNPPYIENSDDHLQQGDLRFEPMRALASGKDGLDDIRRILADCLAYLKPQGWILLEHGFDQASAVHDLMAEAGLLALSTVKDLSGNDRVTMGKNPLLLSQHWAN